MATGLNLNAPFWFGLPRWFWIVVGILALFGVGAVVGCRPDSRDSREDDAGDTISVQPSLDTAEAGIQPDSAADAEALAMLEAAAEQEWTPEDSLPSGPPMRGVVPNTGVPMGLYAWPSDDWGRAPITAVARSIPPEGLLSALRSAKRQGMRVLQGLPRRMVTANGENDGRFSLEKAKANWARQVRLVPPDSLAKYRDQYIGTIVIDDQECAPCWGGQAISYSTLRAWFAHAGQSHFTIYARSRPIHLLQKYPSYPGLDVAVAQYNVRFDRQYGNVARWLAAEHAAATKLGVKLGTGMNVINGGRLTQGSPMSAAQIRAFGTEMLRTDKYPRICYVISWQHDRRHYTSAVRDAFAALYNLARQKPRPDCGP